jgi:hypothetical protein
LSSFYYCSKQVWFPRFEDICYEPFCIPEWELARVLEKLDLRL